MFYEEGSEEYELWKEAMEYTEKKYLKLLETSSPQAARTVLPNSCKTEIIVYCNLVEWQHIFKLRTSQAAEPSMREIIVPLAEELSKRYPML
jgi:thymidylate synthase (FAD)